MSRAKKKNRIENSQAASGNDGESSTPPLGYSITLILITTVINLLGTWFISRHAITLAEEHSLVSALIPALTSNDGIQVRLGLNLLKEAVPQKYEAYKRIIEDRVQKTTESTLKGEPLATDDKQKKIVNQLGKDPELSKIIAESTQRIKKETADKIKDQIQKKELDENVKTLITSGQKYLDEKRCFAAYLAFDAASDLDSKNPVIQTSSKIASQCIEEENENKYLRHLEAKSRKLEIESAKLEGKMEGVSEGYRKMSDQEILDFWNKR